MNSTKRFRFNNGVNLFQSARALIAERTGDLHTSHIQTVRVTHGDISAPVQFTCRGYISSPTASTPSSKELVMM